MTTERRSRAETDDIGNLVLQYMQNTPAPSPGFLTRQIALAIGLSNDATNMVLQRLYVHKLVGRQKAMWGADQASYWLPVVVRA